MLWLLYCGDMVTASHLPTTSYDTYTYAENNSLCVDGPGSWRFGVGKGRTLAWGRGFWDVYLNANLKERSALDATIWRIGKLKKKTPEAASVQRKTIIIYSFDAILTLLLSAPCYFSSRLMPFLTSILRYFNEFDPILNLFLSVRSYFNAISTLFLRDFEVIYVKSTLFWRVLTPCGRYFDAFLT